MDNNIKRISRCHENGVARWIPEEGSPLEGKRFEQHVHLSGAPCVIARRPSIRGTQRLRREQKFIMVARGGRCRTCSLYLDSVYDRYYKQGPMSHQQVDDFF